MEKTIDYKKIYNFQDFILKIIFSFDNSFFLSGGTALHRFYYNLRYSSDLDLFTNDDKLFNEYIKEILIYFLENNIYFDHIVKTRDFSRILIEQKLQVDFVNDRTYRYGKSNLINNNIRVDNVYNILSNKITAIIDRDEEKDIFDLFSIATHERFNWQDILKICNKKANIENDFFIHRLKTFPLEWLENIILIKPLKIDSEMILRMCNDIIEEADNSLFTDI